MVSYDYWELPVHDLKGKMERRELIPDPDWQRGYIWNLKDEQLLIDSILKGIPIPKFFLTQEYDAKKAASIHYVVDGQQRLKAIHRFLLNRFDVEIDGRKYRFGDLDSKTQEKITTYRLNGHYMKDFQQSDINFLFQRLNRTGLKLTNMEQWNNEYYDTNILKMLKEIYEKICNFPHKRDYRDYSDKDYQKLENSYIEAIYTSENVKRMLPLDDITDMCNCLCMGSAIGGGKRDLEAFLEAKKSISEKESLEIKSRFRKTLKNVQEIFSKQELRETAFGKRTHFLSLFLAVGLLIDEYYILEEPTKLRDLLLKFIIDQPDEYKESVLGGIRQKTMRQTRVKYLQGIIKPLAKDLDHNRLFDESLRQKLWNTDKNKTCKICGKKIRNFEDAVVDHIVPWAKGGKTEEANAQLACGKCNRKKRDKHEEYVI